MKKLSLTFYGFLIAFSVSATELTYTELDANGNNRALGYPVPIPVDSQLPVAGFRTYSSLLARLQDLETMSANISSQVIGTTRNNRQIWSFIYSDPDNLTIDGYPEPGTLQQAGIHAREWSTPEALAGVMENFFNHQNDHSLYQYLLENTNMVFTPVLNVDGFLQTQRYADKAIFSTYVGDSTQTPRDGRMRRKNMFNVDELLSTTDDYLLGVDLNRNNLPYWSTSAPISSSSNNQSLIYHGASAASEPEIQAMQNAATLVPTSRIRLYIDTHSFSQIYFTPMTDNDRRNTITEALAYAMISVNNNKYRYGPFIPGEGMGSTDEYFAKTYQIPSYTLETEPLNGGSDYGGFGVTHDGFILPEAEVNRLKTEITQATLAGYYRQSRPPAVNAISITDANGQIIFAGHWSRVNDQQREWNETANSAMIPGNQYQIWVSFNKPMRAIDSNNQIKGIGTENIHLPSIKLMGKALPYKIITQTLTISENDWLINSGGSPTGYENYIADALSVNFTLDSQLDPTQLTFLGLEIDAQDLTSQYLDANPATVAQWKDGAWFQFESHDNQDHDFGDVDKSIRIIDDGSPKFNTPVTTPPQQSSGGGILNPLWFLLLILLKRFKRSGALK